MSDEPQYVPVMVRWLDACRRDEVEDGDDLGPLRALAHHARIGTLAEGERERIDQDRFAGARLAGEGGKSGGKLKVERVDDGEVADGEVQEHFDALGRARPTRGIYKGAVPPCSRPQVERVDDGEVADGGAQEHSMPRCVRPASRSNAAFRAAWRSSCSRADGRAAERGRSAGPSPGPPR